MKERKQQGHRANFIRHYVLMKKIKREWWVFCNGCLWFKSDSEYANEYLTGHGYVSSYLELSKPTVENKTLEVTLTQKDGFLELFDILERNGVISNKD